MNKTEKPINIITSSIFNVAFSLGITSLFEITNNIPTMIAMGIFNRDYDFNSIQRGNKNTNKK
ncbi:hypothetical protein EA049_22915 [Salmonella enterica]|nr:hypothetical protein [Salmonella enterica subsp. enterica serovar Oranienburg]